MIIFFSDDYVWGLLYVGVSFDASVINSWTLMLFGVAWVAKEHYSRGITFGAHTDKCECFTTHFLLQTNKKKKPDKSGLLYFGGESGIRTPDLRIMIPSL